MLLDKRMSLGIYALFVVPWLLIVIMYYLLPLRYSNSLSIDVLIIILIHILGSICGALLSERLFLRGKINLSTIRIKSEKNLIRFFMILSFLSIIFFLYDRIFIQGIDFSQGLAYARESWAKIGSQRVGVSSFWSVFANIFVLSYFPVFILIGLQAEKYRKKKLSFIVFFSYGISLLHASINGGRTPLIFFLISLISVVLCRFLIGRSWTFGVGKFKFILGVFFIFISSFLYANSIFISRANSNNVDTSSYVETFLPYLGGELTTHKLEESSGENGESLYGQLHSVILTGAYFTHGLWKTNSLLPYKSSCYESLRSFSSLFERAGLVKSKQCLLDGFMSPLPTVIWFDFGFLFLGGASILIGGCLMFCLILFKDNVESSYIGFGAVLATMIIISGPFFYLPTFQVFPFAIFNISIFFFLYFIIFLIESKKQEMRN